MSRKQKMTSTAMVWASQNYMTSRRLIKRLLSKTSINATDRVIEIGPGKGHITKALLTACGHLTAVEIDPGLVANLKNKLAGCPHLTLVEADFLMWKLPTREHYKVFASIPFNRTTDIIRKLTEAPNPPREAWLVMERGAALRFMGMPRDNLRSLLIKPRFDMCILHRFKREDFHPAPAVDVVMLHLKLKPVPDIAPAQWGHYQRFVGRCFSGAAAGIPFTKRQIRAALRASGPEDARSGTMRYVQWLCLFRCWLSHPHARK